MSRQEILDLAEELEHLLLVAVELAEQVDQLDVHVERRLDDGYQSNCVYNHPNYPDGFLRTSVRQLSNYARAYLNGGEFSGKQILKPERRRKVVMYPLIQNYILVLNLSLNLNLIDGLQLMVLHGLLRLTRTVVVDIEKLKLVVVWSNNKYFNILTIMVTWLLIIIR